MTIPDVTAASEVTLPDLLYRERGEVKELQDRLLRTTVELCYRGHPYYRRLMQHRGLTPDDIQTSDDLVKLPPTSKKDFMADPEAFRLQVADLPVEQRVLWEVMYTTGTTSAQPSPIYTTTWDHYAYLFHAARCSEILGLTEDDVIANVFPLTAYPMGAYVRAPHTAAATGASIVTSNPGRAHPDFPVHRSLDETVRLIERHRATMIWGVASFVRRVLMRAQELGADFSSVRSCSITGEATSGAMRDDMRRRMADLGARNPRVLNRYGSTESSSMLECREGSGWHNPSPDQVFLEVVDAESHARLPSGASGLLLITHLIRRGTVLLRYALGDIVTMTDERCPLCGRTSERIIAQPVRTKDIVKIKGMLVNLDLLKEELERVPGLDEFQVIIQKSDPGDPFSMDELLVRLAVRDGVSADEVGTACAQRTLAATQVRPRLEFVRRDDIHDPTSTAKLQRIVDRRPTS